MTHRFTFDRTPDEQTVHCSSCGWSGPARDLGLELFAEVLERDCPKCDSTVELLTILTLVDLERAAAEGNQEATEEVERLGALVVNKEPNGQSAEEL